jgi:DNA-binding NarL/FixJ family response regulator
MEPKPVRLLLADDHDVVRAGVRAMVEEHGWEVCGEATNGREALKIASEVPVDIAVLDLELGELDGVTVTRQLKEMHPGMEVVIFTMHDDDYLIREALSAGALSFVLKSEGGPPLMEAIAKAAEHAPFFSTRASEALIQNVLNSLFSCWRVAVRTNRPR